jgi:cysteinyl-tRNA synthetase
MYVCGITPYDEVHLGHARAYVVFDIIKRHLLKRGYQVKHVQNFTDIDDKIIKNSRIKKIKLLDFVQIYIDDYFIQTDKLNILRAEIYPRVTQMIPEIIDFIKELVNKGFTYRTSMGIYFSVKKFRHYGKLSKRILSNMKTGIRINACDEKKSVSDFVLWKKIKGNDSYEVSWESPWGKGRPGWHIECSVMSSKFLGNTIDIHGGGQDLIFPHHENEIAQSEIKSGKQFVRYWIHNGFVTLNKNKMSKSSNNFFALKVIFEKYDPRVVRYYLLTRHYSSPLDFSEEGLNAAKNALQGIDDTYFRLILYAKKFDINIKISDKDLLNLYENFLSALDDNFNSEKALSYLHELKNLILSELFIVSFERLIQLRKLLENFTEISLGITLPKEQRPDENLQKLLRDRNEARKSKIWTESDRLRKLIEEKGYKLIDNKDGTSVLIKKI